MKKIRKNPKPQLKIRFTINQSSRRSILNVHKDLDKILSKNYNPIFSEYLGSINIPGIPDRQIREAIYEQKNGRLFLSEIEENRIRSIPGIELIKPSEYAQPIIPPQKY